MAQDFKVALALMEDVCTLQAWYFSFEDGLSFG